MFRTKYWIWLTMVFGIGNERIWQVMRYFDDPAYAYNDITSGESVKFLTEKEAAKAKEISLDICVELIDWCKSKGYGIVSYSSPQYPPLLRHIYNPPAILYYDGDINALCCERIMTVVGTRRAGAKSLAVADRLCRELALSGNIIASGFAVGVDITAHNSAISVERPTVAVLGCGLDVNYPKENFSYRDKLKQNGIFVTEFAPGTSPFPANFPKRNRILSGIASGVIIIEAGVKSGALITAELALQQGREVFCIPPSDIYDEKFSGNIRFLRDGATAIYGADDIRAYYRQFDLSRIDSAKHSLSYVINDDEDNDDIKKAVPARENPLVKKQLFQSQEEIKPIANSSLIAGLNDEQKEMIRLLSDGEMHIDIISDKMNMDMTDIMMNITELELSGLVKSLPGKLYKLDK